MDKQPMAYPYNGILLNNKKDWTIDTQNNIDRFQINYAEINYADWKQVQTNESRSYLVSFILNSRM